MWAIIILLKKDFYAFNLIILSRLIFWLRSNSPREVKYLSVDIYPALPVEGELSSTRGNYKIVVSLAVFPLKKNLIPPPPCPARLSQFVVSWPLDFLTLNFFLPFGNSFFFFYIVVVYIIFRILSNVELYMKDLSLTFFCYNAILL